MKMQLTCIYTYVFAVLLIIGCSSSESDRPLGMFFGGPGSDAAYKIASVGDGSFVLAGLSFRALSQGQAYALKLDSEFGVQWEHFYGIAYSDFRDAKKTSDGGFVFSGRIPVDLKSWDAFVLKTNLGGSVQWQTTYGTSSNDVAYSALPAADGSYLIVGVLNSEATVSKLNSNGVWQWNKPRARGVYSSFVSAVTMSDNGLLCVGLTDDNQQSNIYLFRCTSGGDSLWALEIGDNTSYEEANSVIHCSDGDYLITGTNKSIGNALVVKIDLNGTIRWQTFIDNSYGNSAIQLSTGDFAIVGDTYDYPSNIMLSLMKSDGTLKWTKTLGDNEFPDHGFDVIEHSNGTIVLAGTSNNGKSGEDILIMQLDSLGNVR